MKKLLFAMMFVAAPLHAQDHAGSTGAQVLQFLPGSRAAALSGAYTAIGGDADALFYNPAGIANLQRAGSLAYERYVSDVAFGSLGAATRLSAFTVGVSVAFLDAGEIREVVPDDEYGGNTGIETGSTLSASETALRVMAGLPLGDGRLRAGASVGFVATAIADQSQGAPFIDVGAQYDIAERVTFGAALKNVGMDLSGDGSDKLPSELRVGISSQASLGGAALGAVGEVVARLGEGSITYVTGIEAGLPATSARPFTILGRVGFDFESSQLGDMRWGGSVGFREINFDYTYQNLEFFGAVHRFGIRASRLR